MKRQAGAAGLALVVLLALLLTGGYSAYAANGLAQRLDEGRSQLAMAISELNGSGAESIGDAQRRLRQAEQAFADARRRARTDPALRLLGALPISGGQVDAAARLGEIGVDLSRAGEKAAGIAVGLAAFRQRVTAGPLAPDQLPALLQQAQQLVTGYQGSIDAIGADLKGAHSARAQVVTSGLLPPLQTAYAEVDHALDEADTAFLRDQDVRRLLSDWLGLPLPG